MRSAIVLLTILITLPYLAEADALSQAGGFLGQQPGTPVPDPLNKILKNERANLFVTGTDLVIGAVIEEGILKSVQTGPIESPTVNIYVPQEGLTDVASGKLSYKDLITNGHIRVEGVGTFSSIKFSIIMFLARLLLILG